MTSQNKQVEIAYDVAEDALILSVPQPTGNKLDRRVPLTLEGLTLIRLILMERAQFEEPQKLGHSSNPTQEIINKWFKHNKATKAPPATTAKQLAATKEPAWVTEFLDELNLDEIEISV